MEALPSPNGPNGRGAGGRFAAGNPGGPGNPHARRTAELRSAMLAAVTDDDVTAIVRGLVDRARAGDTAAAKEVLDRVLGRSVQAVAVDARVRGAGGDPGGHEQTSGPEMAVRMLRCYASLGVPGQRWSPMVDEPYKRWLRGEDTTTRPGDFDELANGVRMNCDGWTMAAPVHAVTPAPP